MSQEELANKVELTRSSIVQIENGKQAITILTLYNVAKTLDMSIYELLPETMNDNDFDLYSSDRVVNKVEVLDLLEKRSKEGIS